MKKDRVAPNNPITTSLCSFFIDFEEEAKEVNLGSYEL